MFAMTKNDPFFQDDLKLTNASPVRVDNAIGIYGLDIVAAALSSVALSDCDAAHTAFSDMEMEEHAECVEFIFMSDDEPPLTGPFTPVGTIE